jgi:hypothetical protein
MKMCVIVLILLGLGLAGCVEPPHEGEPVGVNGLSDFHNYEGQTTPLSPPPSQGPTLNPTP